MGNSESKHQPQPNPAKQAARKKLVKDALKSKGAQPPPDVPSF
jgi:hypothetical protein